MHKMMYGLRVMDKYGREREIGWTTNLNTNLGELYTLKGRIETADPFCDDIKVTAIRGTFLEHE